jgi:GNAT superfamily N-acetyltransferase
VTNWRGVIRPFESADAEAVSDLLGALLPATLNTPESLRWRESHDPGRRSWVALEGDELVGFASSYVQVWTGEEGRYRIWVGVRDDRRRRGIGSALFERALENAHAASTYTTEVDDDAEGLAFAERRGFTRYDSEVMSRLDPARCQLEPNPPEGFRVVGLEEFRGREAELHQFYAAAGGIPPGADKRITVDLFRDYIFGNPMLDLQTSVLVVDSDGRVVSLAWLLVDHERRRAENEWTATLPALRGRRLARLSKVASIRLAAKRGIREIVTGNNPDNLPMRELNRRLGYEELFTRIDLERPAPS